MKKLVLVFMFMLATTVGCLAPRPPGVLHRTSPEKAQIPEGPEIKNISVTMTDAGALITVETEKPCDWWLEVYTHPGKYDGEYCSLFKARVFVPFEALRKSADDKEAFLSIYVVMEPCYVSGGDYLMDLTSGRVRRYRSTIAQAD